jgi:hypothetical protein
MPGKRISELTALSGAGSANNDDVVIFDADASETKRISRSQLAEGMQTDVQVFSNKTIDSANNTLTVNYKEAQVETSNGSRTHLFTTVAALLADTGTYTTYAAGQIVEAGGFRYEVAASGATDQHVTTAGGVKLYVLQTEGGAYPAAAWGLSDTATGSENSAALQAACNAALRDKVGQVLLPSGEFVFSNQIVLERHPGQGISLDLVGPNMWECNLKSEVFGSIAGKDTAGFLFLIDGLRHCVWRGFQIDYSAGADQVGAGGIVGRCRKQSFFHNQFQYVRFDGGPAANREINNMRSMKVIGQEPESESTGYVNYFTQWDNCHFNTAYTHIEAVDGGATNSLSKPNAQFVGSGNLFEKYIISVDFGTADECSVGDSFWQQGFGVAGVNDGFTDAVKFDGSFLSGRYKIEAGAGARPFNLGPNATRVTLQLLSNNAIPGFINPANTGRIFVQSDDIMQGVARINDRNVLGDLNIFGTGVASHAGSVSRKIVVWDRSGNANKLELGSENATGLFHVRATGRTLSLIPASAADNVIVASSVWNQSLMRLSGYYFWVDSSGRLRIKFGAPTSESDGTIVGTQS